MDTKKMRACAPLLPAPGDEVVTQCLDEIERLRSELCRAYRALHGYSNAATRGERLPDAAVGYHAPTVAAASRYVRLDALDGADYFIGKPVSVLHAALRGEGE